MSQNHLLELAQDIVARARAYEAGGASARYSEMA